MSVVDALAWALLFAPIIDWVAVWALHRFVSWFPYLETARERRRVALLIAVLTSVFAFLALTRLGHVDVDSNLVGILLASASLGLTVINASFLWKYRHALFGPRPETPPEE